MKRPLPDAEAATDSNANANTNADAKKRKGTVEGEILDKTSPVSAYHFDHTPPQDLVRPYEYLTRQGGKEVRSKLIFAFNKWLKIPEDKIGPIKEMTGMLHNASLLIDDIEDCSTLRRGVPVAHHIYGTPITINCANYVYFLALQSCLKLGCGKAVEIFTEELLNLHRGQGNDIFWRDSRTCPSEDDYNQMVLDKTGGLFRLAVRLMQCFSDNTDDFTEIVNTLGIYFQIRDDYVNMQSESYMANKSYCEDLTEGKFSFPIIRHITVDPKGFEVLYIHRQPTESMELKKYAVQQMERSGSFQYTLDVINSTRERVLRLIAGMGGNDDLVAIIEHLHSSM